MKIKIVYTLDVSEDSWALNYGEELHEGDMREHVKETAVAAALEQFDRMGLSVRKV